MSQSQSGLSFGQWAQYNVATHGQINETKLPTKPYPSVYTVDDVSEIEGQSTYDIVSAYANHPPISSGYSQVLSTSRGIPQQTNPTIISSMITSGQDEVNDIPKKERLDFFQRYTLYDAESGICYWNLSLKNSVLAISIVWLVYALYIITATFIIEKKLILSEGQIEMYVISMIASSVIIATGSLYGIIVINLDRYQLVKTYSILGWVNFVLIFFSWIAGLVLITVYHASLIFTLVVPAFFINLLSIHFTLIIKAYTKQVSEKNFNLQEGR